MSPSVAECVYELSLILAMSNEPCVSRLSFLVVCYKKCTVLGVLRQGVPFPVDSFMISLLCAV